MEVKNRYANGKIYKIVAADGKCYVGSTCNTLSKRLYQHRKKAEIYPRRKVYAHLSDNWDEAKIVLIENIEVKSKDLLKAREQYYLDELQPELNTNVAVDSCTHGRTNTRCQECFNSRGICIHSHQVNQCKQCSPFRIECTLCSVWLPNSNAYGNHCSTRKHQRNEGLHMYVQNLFSMFRQEGLDETLETPELEEEILE